MATVPLILVAVLATGAQTEDTDDELYIPLAPLPSKDGATNDKQEAPEPEEPVEAEEEEYVSDPRSVVLIKVHPDLPKELETMLLARRDEIGTVRGVPILAVQDDIHASALSLGIPNDGFPGRLRQFVVLADAEIGLAFDVWPEGEEMVVGYEVRVDHAVVAVSWDMLRYPRNEASLEKIVTLLGILMETQQVNEYIDPGFHHPGIKPRARIAFLTQQENSVMAQQANLSTAIRTALKRQGHTGIFVPFDQDKSKPCFSWTPTCVRAIASEHKADYVLVAIDMEHRSYVDKETRESAALEYELRGADGTVVVRRTAHELPQRDAKARAEIFPLVFNALLLPEGAPLSKITEPETEDDGTFQVIRNSVGVVGGALGIGTVVVAAVSGGLYAGAHGIIAANAEPTQDELNTVGGQRAYNERIQGANRASNLMLITSSATAAGALLVGAMSAGMLTFWVATPGEE